MLSWRCRVARPESEKFVKSFARAFPQSKGEVRMTEKDTCLIAGAGWSIGVDIAKAALAPGNAVQARGRGR